MHRRRVLTALGGFASVLAGCKGPTPEPTGSPHAMSLASSSVPSGSPTGPMPSVFIAHGAPPLLDDPKWMGELRAWGAALGKPRAILMISAHWTTAPIAIGATETLPLVYDYYGFPERFYAVKYPSPGAPGLARRVRELLSPHQAVRDVPDRGLDHGVFVPLMAMYPEADVPVLQISVPTLEPGPLLALGRALAPLRDEGVLVAGSGLLTHNLRAFGAPGSPVPSWASEFDAWTADVLARKDVDSLIKYKELAPGVHQSLPTHEHYVPVAIALGAALDGASGANGRKDGTTFPIEGFTWGSFTKRSVQFG